MQHELELLEDLSNETVDSATRKGRKLGFEQGFKQGFKQGLQQMLEQSIEQRRIEVISEFANWLIQRGFPGCD